VLPGVGPKLELLYARLLEREHPDMVVSDMKKSLRVNKVFVDWSQNDDHKTTVCVYSLRAKERPTVSTPVTWDEVEGCLREFYSGSSFVRIFTPPRLPQIAFPLRTNFCDIGFALSPDGERLILVSCIDNLIKGAAGQAVQNMNILLWSKTGYRFVKRQSQSDPNVWVSLGSQPPTIATATSR